MGKGAGNSVFLLGNFHFIFLVTLEHRVPDCLARAESEQEVP